MGNARTDYCVTLFIRSDKSESILAYIVENVIPLRVRSVTTIRMTFYV